MIKSMKTLRVKGRKKAGEKFKGAEMNDKTHLLVAADLSDGRDGGGVHQRVGARLGLGRFDSLKRVVNGLLYRLNPLTTLL